MRNLATAALVELNKFNANVQITTTTLTAPTSDYAVYKIKILTFSHNAFVWFTAR